MSNSFAYLAGKNAYTSEQLTVSTSVVSPTTAKIDNANLDLSRGKATAGVLQVLTGDIYYTLDNSTPSSSNGSKVVAGDVLGLAGYAKLKRLKMVRVGGSDAVVHIHYYN